MILQSLCDSLHPLGLCKTHYDVSSFDKLFAGLEDDAVCEVDEVSQQVQCYPVRDGALSVVWETQAGCDEPGVVVEGKSHQAQPGDVATVCRRGDDGKVMCLITLKTKPQS